jgi:hypothetical protein
MGMSKEELGERLMPDAKNYILYHGGLEQITLVFLTAK